MMQIIRASDLVISCKRKVVLPVSLHAGGMNEFCHLIPLHLILLFEITHS